MATFHFVCCLLACSRPDENRMTPRVEEAANPLSSAPPSASPPPKALAENRSDARSERETLDLWNEAHDKRDVRALEPLYDAEVEFYGKKLSRERVLALKAGAFESAPDYRQSASDVVFETKNESASARFRKTWSSEGTSKKVEANLEFRKNGSRYVIATETDASVRHNDPKEPEYETERSGPNWSCTSCRETRNDGPEWREPSEGADRVSWSVHVSRDEKLSERKLDRAAATIDLLGFTGWTCEVGAARVRELHFPPSQFNIWPRELHCKESAKPHSKLVTEFDCNGRGVSTASSQFELRSASGTVRVRLSCSF